MRRRTTWSVAGAAVLSIALSACGGGASGGSSDTIKLGAWMPLSGAIAATGEPVEAGTKVCFDQVNADGGINGKKVDWIAKDNAYDPQQTVRVARELIGQDEVVAIVGSLGTAHGEATFPYVIEQQGVPILNNYGGALHWYDPPQPGLMGVQTPYETQAELLAQWALEDGAKSITVVHSDPDAFAHVAKGAQDGVEAVRSDAEVTLLPVRIGTTDYAPIVNQVRSQQPDAVVLIMPVDEAAQYLSERQLQKLDVPTYGYSVHAANALLELADDAAEDFKTVSWTLPPADESEAVAEYREVLAEHAPDQKPDFPSLFTYAACKSFVEIVSGIDGDITKDSIREAYESASGVETGILPELNFSKDHTLGTNEVVKVVVEDGEFVTQGDFTEPK